MGVRWPLQGPVAGELALLVASDPMTGQIRSKLEGDMSI
jgi:hypothetical protein